MIVMAAMVACCTASGPTPPRVPAMGLRPTLAAAGPGSDTATSPSTPPPTTGYGAPGGDTSPNSTTLGAGTTTGAPGGDSSPVGESPGGSTRPSNTSR